ncbi:hypothetical protein FACS1894199_16040 [Bacteroidia bacterium]|nr:hypothetical protein FACS1894199_16040 [Bacteroidia bacterium]
MDAHSQPGAEVGLTAGMSYYLGEYNPTGHFKYMQNYYGGLYRVNLNDRYALRVNGILSNIKVEKMGEVGGVGGVGEVGDRGNRGDGVSIPTSFQRSVLEFSALLEFNFLSFMVPKVEHSSLWSPYLYAGVGALIPDNEVTISIPVGIGMKMNVWRQFSISAEWGGRKLFTDRLDGLEDMWHTGETNFMFNKDWFFTGGITIVYRFPFEVKCFGEWWK